MNQQTSDSAPTATAMVTGDKANEGAIAVGPQVDRFEADWEAIEPYILETILEQAEQRGLWWLPDESLPALVRKVDAEGSTRSLTLEFVERAPDSGRAACEQDLSGYEWLDFTDVGDRHDDPIVHELVAYSESWARR